MNYEQICTQAKVIVREAGAFIAQELGKVQGKSVEEKSFNQLVSYVDRTSEELLVQGLQKILPEATFLTEEKTIEVKPGEWQWIIDPLDGTTNFLHGIPVFAVSVALKHDQNIVVGIVLEVNRSELFYAWQGGGAWLNGDRIQVSANVDLSKSLIATGFSVDNFERLPQHLKAFEYFTRHTRGVRRLGAAAVDLAFVACGRFDAFFEYNLNPWDVAAGILLIREAGGRVTDFKGADNALSGKEVLAVSTGLSAEALAIISRIFIS